MNPQPDTEEVPNHHVIAELESTLHARTSELVIANARIRARDEKIAGLDREIQQLRYRVEQTHEPTSHDLPHNWPTGDRD